MSSTVVPNRIVAVGDLHGDLKNTLATFKMAKLIDSQRNWIAGNTILVQTGDVVDRGDDTIELYKLMMKLQMQANEAGGSVLSLLGNHEVMNVNNDLRYVSQGDYDSFGGSEKRKQAWSQNGWLGKYIRKLKITAWVNGTVFFHGGAHPKWAKYGALTLNDMAEKGIMLDEADMWNYKLFGSDGPLWYRGYAEENEAQVCSLLEEALIGLNATRMVVGHTPQLTGKILSRCNHKVHVIDVGISRVYGGHSAALEIIGDSVFGLYPNARVEI